MTPHTILADGPGARVLAMIKRCAAAAGPPVQEARTFWPCSQLALRYDVPVERHRPDAKPA